MRAIEVPPNPSDFIVVKPTTKEFQQLLGQIGYKGYFKTKEFKKSIMPGNSTILMHMIIRGLFGMHVGTGTMSKEWLYVVYRSLQAEPMQLM